MIRPVFCHFVVAVFISLCNSIGVAYIIPDLWRAVQYLVMTQAGELESEKYLGEVMFFILLYIVKFIKYFRDTLRMSHFVCGYSWFCGYVKFVLISYARQISRKNAQVFRTVNFIVNKREGVHF